MIWLHRIVTYYRSFVDDGTISENVLKSGTSDIQSDLNYISLWASENYMKLNPQKCKEMRVCFLREVPDVDPLTIADTPLEVVKSHKVLGTYGFRYISL